jgi:spermidine synthase
MVECSYNVGLSRLALLHISTGCSGLGTGISATSFIRHDISATIVEIDPAVYMAARTYFGLPDPGPENVFLEDARSWVDRRRVDISTGVDAPLFDIVVHDCFSGGSVPEHIFTTEFWEDVKETMQPEGIVVVVSESPYPRSSYR